MAQLNDVDWTQLPKPQDDGAAAHLNNARLPALALRSTTGEDVDISSLEGTTTLYIYPMTGRPDTPLPDGWDTIPGARGCTPQSCAFRDHFADLKALGVDHLFGISTQSTQDQTEASDRLHLPFPLLSDSELMFQKALSLPTFDVDGMTLLKRLTLIIQNGRVIKTFYPVFPPDRNAEDVVAWLRSNH